MADVGGDMDPRELLRAGKLEEARDELGARVKRSPGDTAQRTLLFQVLCFCGQWDRAERHLDVLAAMEPERETGIQVFRNLVRCEKEREDVRARRRRPTFAPETPFYAELYFDMLDKLEQGRWEEAGEVFAEIERQLPGFRGVLNDGGFERFRDTDTLLAPFLEAMVYDRYVWIPLEAVREWTLAQPKTLLDTLWVPVRIDTWQGLNMQCFMPVLYPGSHEHADERVRMGRVTDWVERGGGFARGVGQHVYETDGGDVALLEIRQITFERQVQ